MKNTIAAFFTLIFLSSASFAMRGGGGGGLSGGHSINFGFGYTGASQTDLNSVASNSGGSGAQVSSGYEYTFTYEYRFSSSIFALAFRPSYFSQSASAGGWNNSLTGFTFYPILRFYPLENDMFHLYMQVGLGYGSLSGTTTYSPTSGSVSYSGSAFGAIGGLGVQICFTASHCVSVEGNMRYNPIARSIVSSSSGTFTGTGLTQYGNSQEFEAYSNDVQNTLSGVQGNIQYTLKF